MKAEERGTRVSAIAYSLDPRDEIFPWFAGFGTNGSPGLGDPVPKLGRF